jgi:hypothetical protein
MAGEWKARRARTIQSPDAQHPSSNNQQPTTNHIQHPTTKGVTPREATPLYGVLGFAPHPAFRFRQGYGGRVGHPGDGNGAAGEGSQPPNAEQNSREKRASGMQGMYVVLVHAHSQIFGQLRLTDIMSYAGSVPDSRRCVRLRPPVYPRSSAFICG